MQKYVCNVCGWVYDPELGDPDNGVKTGTAFADVPADWVCPECGVAKSESRRGLKSVEGRVSRAEGISLFLKPDT